VPGKPDPVGVNRWGYVQIFVFFVHIGFDLYSFLGFAIFEHEIFDGFSLLGS
jgi:hypothetical protein